MNVGEWTTRLAQRWPEAACLKYNDLELNQKQFNQRVNRLANAFLEAGLKKGQRVAVILGNSNVFLEVLFALSKIGGIMVPLNFRLAPPELEYIINDSEPIMLLYSPEFLPTIQAMENKLPSIKKFICEMDGGKPEDLEYEAWTAGQSIVEPALDYEVDFEDPHFIMYTSGTTGRPKGAVVRQGQTQWNAINGMLTYPQEETITDLCCAPLFHIGALHASATPNVYRCNRLVLQRFFDPAQALKLIEENQVNLMFGIPVMFLMMCQLPEFQKTDFSSVKFFLTGGSPCPKSIIETYQEKGVVFNQGYGMTETATGITALGSEDSLRKLGSCGKPLFHTDIRLVGMEGKDVAPGDLGEVLIKSPTVIKEYWRRPEETANTIVDGWLHSGDVGYLDEEGYLFLVDRSKDMYISGGENVYPAEVEDVLMSHDAVADAGVIGIPDEKWVEVGLAVLVKTPGMEVTAEEIVEYCKGKLAGYKRPRKVVFIDQLPRTLTGKILKKDLRVMYIKEGQYQPPE